MSQIINKQTIQNQIKTFITLLTHLHTEHHIKSFGVNSEDAPPVFTVNFGRKFARVMKDDSSVYCFIDIATGALLKADSLTAPAKGIRGSIFNPNCDVGTVADVFGSGFYRTAGKKAVMKGLRKITQAPARKQVEVVNLLSGKKVMIDEVDAGGCCDPSTETYHSM